MEAAEALKSAQKPDLRFNEDPAWFLESVNYMDPEDPIDSLLIDYKEDIASDEQRLPTAAQQRRMLKGLENGELDSAQTLVYRHKGLIASVAYPFKGGELASDELLNIGVQAFIVAAKSYDSKGSTDFNDHVASAMHESLKQVLPELASDSFIELPENPMEAVYQFMETVEPAEGPADLSKLNSRRQERERKNFTLEEMTALELMHLTEQEASDLMGYENPSGTRKIRYLVASIKAKLDAKNKEEAALIAYENNMVAYDLLEVPDIENFTLEERRVAMRLDKPNAQICEELDINKNKLDRLRLSLSKKTQARSRVELLLMARVNDFEPTEEEEIAAREPSLLERLTSLEQEVIQRTIYQTDPEIGDDPTIPLNEHKVSRILKNTVRKASPKLAHADRVSLVLELHKQGMEFEVRQPNEPLSELLYADELEAARLAHLPYAMINEELGQSLSRSERGDQIKRIKRKTGARSRQELALIMDMYDDDSEALDRTTDNRWRLAELLGVKSLDASSVDELLDRATDREKEVISTYYLGGDQVTWSEVGESLGLTEANANTIALRAIHRISQQS